MEAERMQIGMDEAARRRARVVGDGFPLRTVAAAIALGFGVGAAGQPSEVGVDAAEEAGVTQTEAQSRPGAAARVVAARPADGDRNTISEIIIEYVRPNEAHPDPAAVLDARVALTEASDGWVAPREEAPTKPITLATIGEVDKHIFYDSALPFFAPAIVARLQDLGLIGVYVEPDPTQFGVVDGEVVDRRDPDDTTLRMQVTTGVVTELRTIGAGERFSGEGERRIDNPAHERIRRRSPVQPFRPKEEGASADEARVDLLRRDAIDDFVFRLNRHPGRRVDVAVAPSGDEPGGVTLDYLVTENRPWLGYYQFANTGTDETDRLRHRFGFIHNQLTNEDDILILDYLTSDFDELHALFGSYERPFPDSDRLRWRIFSNYLDYDAAELGLPDADFQSRQTQFGAEVVWNFEQERDLFLDAVAGFRFDHIDVSNDLAAVSGEERFFTPYAGVRLERQRESERTFASAIFEVAAPGVTNVDEDRLFELGRIDADSEWVKLLYDVTHAFYLEPIFDPDLEDTEGGLAHEIVLSARGQFAFGNRLIPQEQAVAGGLYSVRGYPQSITAGDDVILASAEYRYHVPRALEPSAQPGEFFGQAFRYRPQYAYGPTDWDLILRTFIDVGRTIVHDNPAFERNDTLVGVGLGAELQLTRRASFRVDWGIALTDVEGSTGAPIVRDGHDQWYFVLTLIF